MLRILCLLAGVLALWAGRAQEMPLEYQFGEKYKDRYKYSNLLAFTESGSGDKILIRAYYSGLLIRPKGYLIERYNDRLELIDEFNYKFKGADFVHGFVANGQIYLLFLEYDPEKSSYVYSIHQSPVGDYRFSVEPILTLASEYVDQPLDKNYFNRNFKSGFTTTVLSDPDSRTFAIALCSSSSLPFFTRCLMFNHTTRNCVFVFPIQ